MVNHKCIGGHSDRRSHDAAGMLLKLFHPAETLTCGICFIAKAKASARHRGSIYELCFTTRGAGHR
jgi:hypothetical protein